MQIPVYKQMDRLLEEQSKNLTNPKKLLLHCCCAPCSSYVLEFLSPYFEIYCFFYNPNIGTKEEYMHREEELMRLINQMPHKNPIHFVKGTFEPKRYYDTVKGYEKEPERGKRCSLCFELRLYEAAKKCKEQECDFFATTLTISPLKNAEVINEIGYQIAEKVGVTYLASDFKKKNGYKRSIELSNEYNLYRQSFCGCVFSKGESKMDKKIRVGILGATGMVGQRFVTLLENHPYFEVTVLAASKKNEGKTYADAVSNRWRLKEEIPEYAKNMVLRTVTDVDSVAKDVDFVFSAVDMEKKDIVEFEEAYAKAEVIVVSNNSANRWTDDVPMIIPECNADHLSIIKAQKERLHTEKGFIVVKPNCSIQSYAPVLYALKEFEPCRVVVTTYQAISGAGKNFDSWPEMTENIIPYIGGEEEKSEKEPLLIMGSVGDGRIELAKDLKITCQCVRVPVLDGHTAAVFVDFKKKPTKEQIIKALEEYSGLPQKYKLPHAPKQFIHYFEEDDRPQVKQDVNIEGGMAISIGRMREDTMFDYKFVGLSHNTLRGAAGGGLLTAELLYALGYFK